MRFFGKSKVVQPKIEWVRDGTGSAKPMWRVGEYLTELGLKADVSTSNGGNITSSRVIVSNSARVLLGWCVTESSGSAATKFRLRDTITLANIATAPVFCTVAIAQGATGVPVFLGDQAVICNSGGIAIEMVSGQIEGVIWFG